MIDNKPNNPTGMQVGGKFIVGLIIGILIALLIFIMLIGLSSTIEQALNNKTNTYSMNPIIWLLFAAIGFIATVLGTLALGGFCNIAWADKYYDIGLTSKSTLVANILIFIIFFILYLFVGQVLQEIDTLFLLFAFHLFFSIFISNFIIEFVTNPNYGGVHIIGSTIGITFTILFFMIIYNIYSAQPGESAKYLILFPSILGFSIIPLASTLWEKLYYKFYEMGNDFLYVPSLSDVMVDEEEVDEINVEG